MGGGKISITVYLVFRTMHLEVAGRLAILPMRKNNYFRSMKTIVFFVLALSLTSCYKTQKEKDAEKEKEIQEWAQLMKHYEDSANHAEQIRDSTLKASPGYREQTK
jgi:uncharacterized ion transporter superfamily protein YfcC